MLFLAVAMCLGFAATADAGWLGFRNDTNANISIQVSTSGKMAATITLGVGETTWRFVADDSSSTVTVSNGKKSVLVRFETVMVTKKEDVLYAIASSGKDSATAGRVPGAKKGK